MAFESRLHAWRPILVIDESPAHGGASRPRQSEESRTRVIAFARSSSPRTARADTRWIGSGQARAARPRASIATPRNKLSRINHFHFYTMNAEFHELPRQAQEQLPVAGVCKQQNACADC